MGKLQGLCAPRGALLYPRFSREGLGGRFLGLMAYLDPKGEGDKSMPENQRPGSVVRDGALGDPRDMAKAGLLEAQSPEDASSHPPERHLKPVPALSWWSKSGRGNLRGAGRCPARAFKEMSGAPTSRCYVRTETNVGSPTGCESYGDGGPVVVAGVTTGQGGRESRPQGEGGQVIEDTNQDREVCEMQNAETVLGVLRERGRRGLPCEELYRQLFNPQLYLLAYGRIYANKGAMTPGVTSGNRGRHVHGEDRSHHRCDAPRALPLPAGPAGAHPEEEREDAPAGVADLVGQARR